MSDNPTPTAEFIKIDGRWILVRCCWCGSTHAHTNGVRGSAEVLAACSRPGDLKTYAIPNHPPRAKAQQENR